MKNRLASVALILFMGAGFAFVHRGDRRDDVLAALQAFESFVAADSRVDQSVLLLLSGRATSFDDVQRALAEAHRTLQAIDETVAGNESLAVRAEKLRDEVERKEEIVLRVLALVGQARGSLRPVEPADASAELDATVTSGIHGEIESLRFELQSEGRAAGVRASWLAIVAIVSLGGLAFAVQQLVGRLEVSRNVERGMKHRLEVEVDERTRELKDTNQRLAADIERREKAESERDRMEVELQHAQKLESVGRLAAGIAHEINTPAQYVSDNTRFLSDVFRDVMAALRAGREVGGAEAAEIDARVDAFRAQLAKADVEFLETEVPQAIEQCLEGLERISTIVRAMKDFSHPGQEKIPANLNDAITTTVTVARNEWKYVAEVETELDPALPPVPCVVGELNQVVLNMIVNAAHAIADVVGDGERAKGRITIGTRREGDHVVISIADTGAGMTEEVRKHAFDPFFTTKVVGKGTGQGLAIAHSVIYDKHGGTIAVDSTLGKGTEFRIRLPLGNGDAPVGTPEAAEQEIAAGR